MIPAAALPSIVRTVVIPMTATAVLIGSLLASYWRSRRSRGVEGPAPAGSPVRHIALTAGGGYVAFMAIVILTSPAVARPAALIREAAWGGAFLAGTAALVFMLLSLAWSGRGPRREPNP